MLSKLKKESVQFITSLIVLVAGMALVFIGLFLQPVGVIHYSVLTAFGMFLTFVGAVWQIDVKYTYKTEEMRNNMILEQKRQRYNKMIEDSGEEIDDDIN